MRKPKSSEIEKKEYTVILVSPHYIVFSADGFNIWMPMAEEYRTLKQEDKVFL